MIEEVEVPETTYRTVLETVTKKFFKTPHGTFHETEELALKDVKRYERDRAIDKIQQFLTAVNQGEYIAGWDSYDIAILIHDNKEAFREFSRGL